MLREFAQRHNLYLDAKGPRPARRGRKKVNWTDLQGNAHDLDYVMERGGTAEATGTPVAFIETAWRRYAKHSRNKAQEIQGAILPLKAKHKDSAPFVGAVLAGVFTDDALNQMRSERFSILYFPYVVVIKAFRSVGIDAEYDEGTPDAVVEGKVRAWEDLSEAQRQRVAEALIRIDSEEVQGFMRELEMVITRQVESVRVIPLYGSMVRWNLVEEAISFIEGYDEDESSKPFVRYEIEVRYKNGDRIEGSLTSKESAVQFLRAYVAL